MNHFAPPWSSTAIFANVIELIRAVTRVSPVSLAIVLRTVIRPFRALDAARFRPLFGAILVSGLY